MSLLRLSTVQADASERLMAAAAIAALGEPLRFGLRDDPQANAKLVADRILAKGAAVVIGWPTCPREVDTIAGVLTPTTAVFFVYIVEGAEEPTPSGLALVETGVAAMCSLAGLNPSDPGFTFGGYDAGLNEQGLVTHVLAFTRQIAFASS